MGNAIYRMGLGGSPYQIWETQEYGELTSPFLTVDHPFQVIIYKRDVPGSVYVIGGKTIFDQFYIPETGESGEPMISMILWGTNGGVAYEYDTALMTWQQTHIFDLPEEYEEEFPVLDFVGFSEEFYEMKYNNHTYNRGPV